LKKSLLWGCGQKIGLFYDAILGLFRYSRRVLPPNDLLIRFSKNQT